jgi:hypothetical protein
MKKNKYKNIKKEYDGMKFDSLLELKRYKELKLSINRGAITDLELQPKFVILDTFYVLKNGKKECMRKHTYSADFQYMENGLLVVEDFKGMETDVYRNNRKFFLMNCEYDIFRESKKGNKIIDYRRIE